MEKLIAYRRGYKIILITCFALFAVNTLHQVYFTVKTAFNYREMKEGSVREQDYVFFERLLKKTIDETPGKEIIVASDDKYYTMLASMLQAKGVADLETLNNYVPVVSQPSLLFVIFYGENADKYAGYLQNNDAKLIKEVAGTRFYVQLLTTSGKK